jgi:hypothetical protein
MRPAALAPAHRRRWSTTWTAGLITVLLATTALPAGSSTARTPRYDYGCCQATLVNTVYHPGDRIALHWIRRALSPSTRPPVTMTLSVTVTGPYVSVMTLKLSATKRIHTTARFTLKAPAIKVFDTIAARPVSVVRLPASATAGYYNLATKVSTTNFGVGAATIIRVTRSS